MMRAGLLLLALSGSVGAQQPKGSARPTSPKNPAALQATQRLEVRRPGVAPKVRFSWERVAGAEEYVLTGRWTDARSWTLRSQEFRITPNNATRWGDDSVAFDVALAEGSYSWQLVAVFGANDAGDYAHPARTSFDIR